MLYGDKYASCQQKNARQVFIQALAVITRRHVWDPDLLRPNRFRMFPVLSSNATPIYLTWQCFLGRGE